MSQGRHTLDPLALAWNPGSHDLHTPEPGRALVPGAHVVQTRPSELAVPDGHSAQSIAPGTSAVVPSGHASQTLAPAVDAWVPGAHTAHERAPTRLLYVP